MQGLYALDAADGSTEHPLEVANLLIQALLQCVHYVSCAVRTTLTSILEHRIIHDGLGMSYSHQ